jgi:hypothetical protein
VAVEVDGPSHFVGHSPTGATALKRRQLRAAGWPLLAVPYWEWAALDGARRLEYLRRGLAEAIAVAGPPSSGLVASLGWNAFRSSVKGQGLPADEVNRRYWEQMTWKLREIAGGGGGDSGAEETAAQPRSGPAASLGWNAFRSSVKGQGLPTEEVKRRYWAQLTWRLREIVTV